jgi:ribokinase
VVELADRVLGQLLQRDVGRAGDVLLSVLLARKDLEEERCVLADEPLRFIHGDVGWHPRDVPIRAPFQRCERTMPDMLAGADLEPALRDRLASLRLAVVGHVEWAEFLKVPHLPAPGEITHVTEHWEAAAGGGAVTAVQLAQLAGRATFFTALGDDELGHRAADELERLGVDVRAAFRPEPQRRVIVHLEPNGERTITVIGDRLGPRGMDPLGWDEVDFDAVYFTAGDVGALQAARRATVLTATARALTTLREANVQLDALVHSRLDEGERYEDGDLDPAPELVVSTERNTGGRWTTRDGRRGTYDAIEPPGPVRDTYGCGDAFAGGLTAGLGAGLDVDATLDLAARCGAWVASLDGPYGTSSSSG